MPYLDRLPSKIKSRTATVLTDVQFWVPVAVLVAGLLLLRFIH